MKKNRRRNYFTKKKMQIHFAVTSSLLIFTSTVFVWILMNYVLQTSLRQPISTLGELPSLVMKSNFVILGCILADTLVIFLMSIYFSHYVAGPVHRIERSMGHLIDTGHVRHVVLRKRDLMHDTAALLNRLIDKIGKSHKTASAKTSRRTRRPSKAA